MNDDLNAWSRIVRSTDEERKARVAGVLSVVAICMLLITSVTVAHRGTTIAAPPAVSSSAFPPTQPAVAASYVPCPKLRAGKWLRAEIAQQARDGWRIACVYEGDQLMTRDEARL